MLVTDAAHRVRLWSREASPAVQVAGAPLIFAPDLDALDARYGQGAHARHVRGDAQSIDLSRYPSPLVRAARTGWTEAAFNEATTLDAFEDMRHALARVGAPPEFDAQLAQFCVEEALHVDLTVGIAEAFGGLVVRPFALPVADAAFASEEPVVALLRHVVRVCCVGEAFSLPMLAAARRGARIPMTGHALRRIVEDERDHGAFGYRLLDWALPRLHEGDRERLAETARVTLQAFAPLWRSLTSTVTNGVTSEGYRVEHVNEVGFVESSEYRRLALRTIERAVVEPLARRGIHVPLDGIV